MPRYTIQTVSSSGSFASPEGHNVQHAWNRTDIKAALIDWEDEHWKVGAEPTDASLLVWVGEYYDVTDVYPDMEVHRGPKGGIVFNNV